VNPATLLALALRAWQELPVPQPTRCPLFARPHCGCEERIETCRGPWIDGPLPLAHGSRPDERKAGQDGLSRQGAYILQRNRVASVLVIDVLPASLGALRAFAACDPRCTISYGRLASVAPRA
jgi:hypothetical protein